MGDSSVVGSKSNDGGFPDTLQVSGQNSVQNLETDSSRKGSNRPPHLPSTSSNYPPSVAYSQLPMSHATPESFNMTALGATLPDMSYQHFGQRFPQSPGAPPHFMYQTQFANQGIMSPPPTAATYNAPYQTQYGIYPSNQQMQQQHMHMAPNNAQFYVGQGYMGQPQQQAGSQYYIQPGTFGQQGQNYTGNQMGSQYPQRGSFSGDSRPFSQQRNDLFVNVTGQAGRSNSVASSPTQSTVVRGPPRKPRQSGHAIWIGNLPPQTDLMSLVLHVCKETVGLESLFLISKSNCAFANFKDEAACVAAQLKIHDSRFQTVRLVSRLRKASLGTPSQNPSPVSENEKASKEAVEKQQMPDGESSPLSKDKYFVVKSLTVEDLELSVRNGIWATQTHNEEALNEAYQTADNVYLIFSANKSGEYFGYARMISPINNDPAAAIEFAPKAQTVEDPDLPKAIPTPASEFAPKGRIIDDSARGTIFWEIERDEPEDVDEDDKSQSGKSDVDGDAPSKAWGKPFKLEWISTTRLPFYRTRGLRNPWNSNREVKIARDGTELETSIGKRLVGLFHRVQSPVAPNLPQMQGMGMPIQMMPLGGYPQMRPYN
ncbi:4ae0da81-dcda-412f-a481-07960a0d47e7 [Sclerotinia trifoliorum]|uniref:4ae0da81-dcda-412f-a481-07960a0d47e7 n=1 Tax=Sclerotinia trifoliorum TaxID=28548 RepID=A0A8H2ZM12_9HELO|nr:4ae0da81-dcda-412f-a481-07960a0d47e7 [Sclerotinia trifoliorum]